MGKLEEILNSDWIIIVLAVVLVVLVSLFTFIHLKQKKKRRKLKQDIAVDENNQLKIVPGEIHFDEPRVAQNEKIEEDNEEIKLTVEQVIKTDNGVEIPSYNPQVNQSAEIEEISGSSTIEEVNPVVSNPIIFGDEPKVDKMPKVQGLNEFPDFTGLNGNDSDKIAINELESGLSIEDKIIDSAKKYVDSIMNR